MSKHPTFNWRGQPSEIGKTLIKTSGSTAPAKAHPMRNGTSSINTETLRAVDKKRRIQRGSMR